MTLSTAVCGEWYISSDRMMRICDGGNKSSHRRSREWYSAIKKPHALSLMMWPILGEDLSNRETSIGVLKSNARQLAGQVLLMLACTSVNDILEENEGSDYHDGNDKSYDHDDQGDNDHDGKVDHHNDIDDHDDDDHHNDDDNHDDNDNRIYE